VHSKGRFKNHTKGKVGERSKFIARKKHKKEEVKIHCKTCNESGCGLCPVSSEQLAESRKQEIEKGLQILSQRTEKLLKVKAEVEHSIKQVNEVSVSSCLCSIYFDLSGSQ
jgi:hypothetical protein